MIQRIQSVYLFVVFILSLVLLFMPLVSFVDLDNQTKIILNAFHFVNSKSEVIPDTPLLVSLSGAIIFVVLDSLIAIFVFKNRKTQMKMCMYSILMQIIIIGLIVYYSYIGNSGNDLQIKPQFAAVLPLITLVVTYLAYRGIKKDENLVKSFDRLR